MMHVDTLTHTQTHTQTHTHTSTHAHTCTEAEQLYLRIEVLVVRTFLAGVADPAAEIILLVELNVSV